MARLQFAYTPSDYFSRVVKLIGATYEVGGQQYSGNVDIVGFTAATGAVYDEPNGTQQTDLLVDGQASSTVPAASAETVAFEGPDGVEQDLWLTADSGSNWFRMIPDWSTVIAAIKTRLLPSGGTTGQLLSKKSNTSYDTEWKALLFDDLDDVDTTGRADGDVPVYVAATQTWVAGAGIGATGLPSGGAALTTLVKASATNYDVAWYTGSVPTVPITQTAYDALSTPRPKVHYVIVASV